VTNRVVAATRNAHKLSEIKRILRGTGLTVKPLDLFPPVPEVKETGLTLAANAAKKARAVSRALGMAALSDDSGLFVPALGGRPGVRSARYAGPACDYAANNRKLLRAMRNLRGRGRRAFFATAVALVRPGRKAVIRIGKAWGVIATEARGRRGFGYDPLFIPRGEARTFAEMALNEKNRISHRARALRRMAEYLRAEKSQATQRTG
jgi:XTP/dITP diphosphohydrolase